jgi:hypothetical protein
LQTENPEEPNNEDTFSDQYRGRPSVCYRSIRPVAELYNSANPGAANLVAGAAEIT